MFFFWGGEGGRGATVWAWPGKRSSKAGLAWGVSEARDRGWVQRNVDVVSKDRGQNQQCGCGWGEGKAKANPVQDCQRAQREIGWVQHSLGIVWRGRGGGG